MRHRVHVHFVHSTVRVQYIHMYSTDTCMHVHANNMAEKQHSVERFNFKYRVLQLESGLNVPRMEVERGANVKLINAGVKN